MRDGGVRDHNQDSGPVKVKTEENEEGMDLSKWARYAEKQPKEHRNKRWVVRHQ